MDLNLNTDSLLWEQGLGQVYAVFIIVSTLNNFQDCRYLGLGPGLTAFKCMTFHNPPFIPNTPFSIRPSITTSSYFGLQKSVSMTYFFSHIQRRFHIFIFQLIFQQNCNKISNLFTNVTFSLSHFFLRVSFHRNLWTTLTSNVEKTRLNIAFFNNNIVFQ